MSSVSHHEVSQFFPRDFVSATAGEKALTVLAAPNEFLMSVMQRSVVAVGNCVGRQDLERKRGTSGFSAREFYPTEVLSEFNLYCLHDLALQLYQKLDYYTADTIFLQP